MSHCPRRGDVVWLGHGPALTLSPEPYNRKVGLALFCPITSQVKGFPFEVALPPSADVKGVILADQVKSLDWRARGSKLVCSVPPAVVEEVLRKLEALLE